jgi:hypothetical protein
VGEAGALVVFGIDEDLGLASESAKCRGMEDAVTVSLKTGAPLVGLFFSHSIASTK